jgi:DNA-3-methyladenine glycosylase II
MKLTPPHIQSARRHLRAADPVMRSIIDAVGPYTLRFEKDRFGLLVRSIVSQQISTIAARAIRKRLLELAGPDGLTAGNLAQFTVEQLRSVGLSQQKASYVADLSCKVNDGTVDLRGIGRLSDERVVETLTQVKGIGRWTAQMFLIFSLGRPDVFPHDDLGVRTAIRDRYQLDNRRSLATVCLGGKLVLLAVAGFGEEHGDGGDGVSIVGCGDNHTKHGQAGAATK